MCVYVCTYVYTCTNTCTYTCTYHGMAISQKRLENKHSGAPWYVHVYVPWYHGTYSSTMVHVYVHVYLPWYTCPYVRTRVLCSTYHGINTGTRVQIKHYLKNDLKYKHSGATGTLASGRCQHRRHHGIDSTNGTMVVHVPFGIVGMVPMVWYAMCTYFLRGLTRTKLCIQVASRYVHV
jgi:hypothetical protein